jgi:hypothetical protein
VTESARRRVVSGKTATGAWGILADGPVESVERHEVQGSAFDVVHFWDAGELSLETIDRSPDANLSQIFALAPGSSRFFVESMAPTAAATGWHRTNTIDYEYIVSGRIDLLMEDGSSTTLEAGDVNVQLGGMHQWWNRYEEPCVLAIIMVGVPSDETPGVLIPPLDEAQTL